MLDYAYPEVLVDSQWLLKRVDDPNIRIIEIDVNPQFYHDGHIRGSISWSLSALLSPNMSINLEPSAMEELLSRSGIGNNDTVIIVNGDYVGTSGSTFWLMKIFGHEDVKILNGGRKKWKEEGLPLTTESTTIAPTNYNISRLDSTLRILSDEVKDSMLKEECILLDVRTLEEYQGKIYLQEPPQEDERAGHIPGAINLHYELAHNEDETFKSANELQKIFTDSGVTADKFIIPYCAVGGRSGHIWFVLKYLLGYPQVKNYDGSWNEWSRLDNTLIER